MFHLGRCTFKRAEAEFEFEQIHALNYSTFVREIRQHDDPGDGRLVDKFHSKSAYFIALRDSRIVGMVSLHDQPPFSVASRLPDPLVLESPGVRPLEIRLLAVESRERRGLVVVGLFWALYEHAIRGGYTHLFISGLESRLRLYSRLGFEALGPTVESGLARFVPMSLPVARLRDLNSRLVALCEAHVHDVVEGPT